MAKEQKTNLYLLSIVAIVAVVGIVVLILNSGAGSVSLSSDDLSGEAIKMSNSKVKELQNLQKLQEELQAKMKELSTTNAENPLCPAPCGSEMARMCGQECD